MHGTLTFIQGAVGFSAPLFLEILNVGNYTGPSNQHQRSFFHALSIHAERIGMTETKEREMENFSLSLLTGKLRFCAFHLCRALQGNTQINHIRRGLTAQPGDLPLTQQKHTLEAASTLYLS